MLNLERLEKRDLPSSNSFWGGLVPQINVGVILGNALAGVPTYGGLSSQVNTGGFLSDVFSHVPQVNVSGILGNTLGSVPSINVGSFLNNAFSFAFQTPYQQQQQGTVVNALPSVFPGLSQIVRANPLSGFGNVSFLAGLG